VLADRGRCRQHPAAANRRAFALNAAPAKKHTSCDCEGTGQSLVVNVSICWNTACSGSLIRNSGHRARDLQ